MPPMPTLEDLAALLEAQNAELSEAERLAETIPSDVMLDKSALDAFDDCVEPRPAEAAPIHIYGIRA